MPNPLCEQECDPSPPSPIARLPVCPFACWPVARRLFARRPLPLGKLGKFSPHLVRRTREPRTACDEKGNPCPRRYTCNDGRPSAPLSPGDCRPYPKHTVKGKSNKPPFHSLSPPPGLGRGPLSPTRPHSLTSVTSPTQARIVPGPEAGNHLGKLNVYDIQTPPSVSVKKTSILLYQF